MSGIEVCRFVRQTRDRITLPILMLTGNTSEEVLIECLESGANDFVTKPFRAPELLARVETLGGVSRQAAVSRQREAARTAALLRDAEDATNKVHAKLVEQDRYIGILGHDLRNPLSAIVVAAAMLERKPDSVTQRAGRIQRSAARMALMINDVLDFARGRLDSGVPITPRSADMRAICADIVDELGVANPGREIGLEVTGDVSGVWDPDRLQQAISNLVGNALEHSDSVVTIRVIASAEGGRRLGPQHGPGDPARRAPRCCSRLSGNAKNASPASASASTSSRRSPAPTAGPRASNRRTRAGRRSRSSCRDFRANNRTYQLFSTTLP